MTIRIKDVGSDIVRNLAEGYHNLDDVDQPGPITAAVRSLVQTTLDSLTSLLGDGLTHTTRSDRHVSDEYADKIDALTIGLKEIRDTHKQMLDLIRQQTEGYMELRARVDALTADHSDGPIEERVDVVPAVGRSESPSIEPMT